MFACMHAVYGLSLYRFDVMHSCPGIISELDARGRPSRVVHFTGEPTDLKDAQITESDFDVFLEAADFDRDISVVTNEDYSKLGLSPQYTGAQVVQVGGWGVMVTGHSMTFDPCSERAAALARLDTACCSTTARPLRPGR